MYLLTGYHGNLDSPGPVSLGALGSADEQQVVGPCQVTSAQSFIVLPRPSTPANVSRVSVTRF